MVIKRVLKEGLPILFLVAIGGALTGFILTRMESALQSIAGLLVILPALFALRGNISASLGSRLGSGFATGAITTDFRGNKELFENIKASLLLSSVLSAAAGVIAVLFLYAYGINDINPFVLFLIAFFGGSISGLISPLVTILLANIAFRRGLDVDNILNPIITVTGDILTISCVFLAIFLVIGL
ncbi:MAG: magnesium transporter [Promethearchaeota archaeon]|jgi:mgtE-like transporter